LGAGAAARGAAELELVAFRGACPACAPRPLEPRFAGVLSHELFGACGEVRGTVWFRVQPGSGAAVQPLRRDEAPLEPLSRPGCY
ncbi:MAG TPA: hypothetical protein VFO79_14140, partial [Xanthomonadales bacterium]|nr:hypothetical protein [Xanthomonadales bacterium]